MFDIKSLVRKGVPMEDIIELQAEYERDQLRVEASKLASEKYYTEKATNGKFCTTCGCNLSSANTSGYCRKHVSATIQRTPREKVAYVTKVIYGGKKTDLLDNHYYQGGSVSPR